MKTTITFLLSTILIVTSMTLPTHAENSILAPDIIIVNAIVRTMDASLPTADAIAIHGNRIVAVGSDKEIRKLAGPKTRVIDAKKQLVLPGFNDAHVHFLSGGFQLSSVDLRDASTPEEFAERIRRFATTVPSGRWITGGDWDHGCERWSRSER